MGGFIKFTETDFGSKSRAKYRAKRFSERLTTEGKWRLKEWWNRVLLTAQMLCLGWAFDTGTLWGSIRIEEKDIGSREGFPFEVAFTSENVMIHSQIIAGGSDYINPKTGRICVPTGTEIISENGLKTIEDIEVGEKTIDKENNLVTIYSKSSRHYNGNLVEIKPLGLFPFRVTPNHEIWLVDWKSKMETVSRRRVNWNGLKRGLICRECGVNLTNENWYPSHREKKDYICKDCSKNSRKYIHEISGKYWSKASDLKGTKVINSDSIRRIRQCVVFPKYKKERRQFIFIKGKRYEVDEEFAGLFGLFYAEGGTYMDKRRKNSGRTTFTNSEEEILEFIRRVFMNKFAIKMGRQDTHTTTLYKDDVDLARFFEKHFGHKPWNKRVPSFIMDSPKNIVKSFIHKLIKGDGTEIVNGRNITTTSKLGVLQIQKLLSKLDVFGGISVHKIKEGEEHIYNGQKITSKHDRYTINIRGKQIEKLGYKHDANEQKYYCEDENYFYLPIRKIKHVPYRGLVWDISTNGTFQLSNIVIHNCDYAMAVHDGHFTRTGRWVAEKPFLREAIEMHRAEFYRIINSCIKTSEETEWVGR